jgi:hypothetical protein
LLQKSFWGGERKFLEPLMRFTRGEVRDHAMQAEATASGDENVAVMEWIG